MFYNASQIIHARSAFIYRRHSFACWSQLFCFKLVCL